MPKVTISGFDVCMRDYLLLEMFGIKIRAADNLGEGFIYIPENYLLLVDSDLAMPAVFALAREILPQAVTAATRAMP